MVFVLGAVALEGAELMDLGWITRYHAANAGDKQDNLTPE